MSAASARDASQPVVHVSAAVVTDERERALVVRKHSSLLFQQPGGKPEPGEDARQTVVREVAEEIGVTAAPSAFTALGRFTEAAANEPGHLVVADAFALRIRSADAVAAGEIAELRWLDRDDLDAVPLAPLSRNLLLPLAWP